MTGTMTDGFDEQKKINKPKINNEGKDIGEATTGLIPIKFVDNHWEVCSKDDPKWYSYETDEMKWANAMASDGTYKVDTVKIGQEVKDEELGSMFVWIPRFAYSMTHYRQAIDGTKAENDGTTQNITKVEFLKGTTNIGVSDNRFEVDYNSDSVEEGQETPMIVHPAFNFGGVEIQGFWMAKFQASMLELNDNTPESNNTDTKTVKILPNVESWRYIKEENMFTLCLELKNKEIYKLTGVKDSHQIKNIEWGAVAYLAASQYGKVPAANAKEIVYQEDEEWKTHLYTASSDVLGDYKTSEIVNQSTTGNVYGVYDMNGGGQERTAALYANSIVKNIGTYFGKYTTENKIKPQYAKYFDIYEVGEDEATNVDDAWNNGKSEEGNKRLAKMAWDKVQKMKGKKGDATYEVIDKFSYYGWKEPEYTIATWMLADYDADGTVLNTKVSEGYSKSGTAFYGGDYILMCSIYFPTIERGGYSNNGPVTGIFSLYSTAGDMGRDSAFRPVLMY